MALLMPLVLGTGCSTAVSGTPIPDGQHFAPGIEQILLTMEEADAIADSPLEPNGPPVVGGPDKLDSGLKDDKDVSPIECVGPVAARTHLVYQQASVRAVASQGYWNHTAGAGGVMNIDSTAIELASDVAARKVFESSVRQWESCANRAVIITKADRASVMWKIQLGRVDVAGPLLTADSSWRNESPQPPIPETRILGIAANVVVEATVAMDPYHGPAAPVGDRATRAANAMLRKVTATS